MDNYGLVIEEIFYGIVDECDNDVITTFDLMHTTAKALDKTYKEIYQELYTINSDFVTGNNIVGFIDKQPVTRSHMSYYFNKTIRKFLHVNDKIQRDYDEAKYVLELLHAWLKPTKITLKEESQAHGKSIKPVTQI